MIDFSKYNFAKNTFQSILCLDGDLPEANFFQQMQLPIIAADGAANKLMRMGIKPQMTIGDLDGIDPALLKVIPHLLVLDQNQCDYQKSLTYLEEKNLLPAIICGINGGRLDHILNNINLFLQQQNFFYSDDLLGFVMCAKETKTLHLPKQTEMSLLGIPSATISSNGLQWELSHYAADFPGANSCFNRTLAETVQLTVHTGKVLVLIHQP